MSNKNRAAVNFVCIIVITLATQQKQRFFKRRKQDMLGANVQTSAYGVQLPSIRTTSVCASLLFGFATRTLLISGSWCFLKSAYASFRYSAEEAKEKHQHYKSQAVRYTSSLFAEAAFSTILVPMRYLAAVTTQRFLFDFGAQELSELLSWVDLFDPARFMSFSQYAFQGDQSEDWNWDFFVWQLPAVALIVGKLMYRRHALGAERCKTKRVLGMLVPWMFIRAFLASFSVQIPQTEGDALVAIGAVVVESLMANYLIANSWPLW